MKQRPPTKGTRHGNGRGFGPGWGGPANGPGRGSAKAAPFDGPQPATGRTTARRLRKEAQADALLAVLATVVDSGGSSPENILSAAGRALDILLGKPEPSPDHRRVGTDHEM